MLNVMKIGNILVGVRKLQSVYVSARLILTCVSSWPEDVGTDESGEPAVRSSLKALFFCDLRRPAAVWLCWIAVLTILVLWTHSDESLLHRFVCVIPNSLNMCSQPPKFGIMLRTYIANLTKPWRPLVWPPSNIQISDHSWNNLRMLLRNEY